MDFRNVTELTIPAGSVKKISIGGVVYWNKEISNGNKYSIMKNGVQIAQLTISQLVKRINSGYAKENYGIGAQIIVPYCYNLNYNWIYDLPFNFGTFTAYGEGKLGLQAHQAVPEENHSMTYCNFTQDNSYSAWPDSYGYEWLNSTLAGYRNDTFTVGYTKPGFLKSLPEDFVEAMNTTNHGNIDENGDSVTVSSKVFLPGATNMFAKTGEQIYDTQTITVYETVGDGEKQVWEYWQNRIISEQTITNIQSEVTEARKTYVLPGSTLGYNFVILPNKARAIDNGTTYWRLLGFDQYGRYLPLLRSVGKYLPACVIG